MRGFFVFLALVLMGLAGCSSPGPGRLVVGAQAPDFSAKDLDGSAVRLAAMRGAPAVLRFFQPDCPFCRADTRGFSAYQEKNHGRGLRTVYIAEWPKEDEVRSFRDRLGIGFPVIFDKDGAIAARFFVRTLPETVIVGPDGKVAAVMVGGVSEAQLAEVVDPLFAGK
jgi:peroxiredoxin